MMEESDKRMAAIRIAIDKTASLIKALDDYRYALDDLSSVIPLDSKSDPIGFSLKAQLAWMKAQEEKLKAHGIDELLRKTE